MELIINNRLVNLWRGDKEPPTKYHIWIKDNKLLLFDGNKWVVFIDHYLALLDTKEIRRLLDKLNSSTINNKKILDNPVLSSMDLLVGKSSINIQASHSIQKALEILDNKYEDGYDINITENADSSISVDIGGHSFKIFGTGVIDVSTSGNNIVIDSDALNSIDTEYPLEWTKDKKLKHSKSLVTAGIYGNKSDQTRVNSFIVPSVVVNSTGHVEKAENNHIVIRDYVDLKEDNTKNEDKDLLLSFSDTSQANPVIKANGLKFNNFTKELEIPGTVVIKGGTQIDDNLVITKGHKIIGELEGSVIGTATPKIHTSETTEYGPASTKLYGHVLILDTLGVEAPPPSNTNSDPTNQDLSMGVLAVAASPRMVWLAREDAKQFTRDYFSDDFIDQKGKIYLNWKNI